MLCISDNVSFDYKPLPGNVFHCTLSHANIVTLLTCVQLHHDMTLELPKSEISCDQKYFVVTPNGCDLIMIRSFQLNLCLGTRSKTMLLRQCFFIALAIV